MRSEQRLQRELLEAKMTLAQQMVEEVLRQRKSSYRNLFKNLMI